MAEGAREPAVSDEGFQELVSKALEQATACLEDRDEGPLLPFAMIVDDGEATLRHFVSRGYEQTLDGALAFAGQGGYDFWAVAWDGYMTFEGRRTEAIFVRAGGQAREESVLFAWRYERPIPDRSVRHIGSPLFLGAESVDPAEAPEN